MPTGAFNICCPRDCVSRTENFERTGRHKWVNNDPCLVNASFGMNSVINEGENTLQINHPGKMYVFLGLQGLLFERVICAARKDLRQKKPPMNGLNYIK